MSDKTGGPAYPHDGQADYTGGMTLRDYFAAKALISLPLRDWSHIKNENDKPEAWAIAAYIVADEMLRAREASDEA